MMKTILGATLLAILPGLSVAQGCDRTKTTAMSCADGTVPDPETGACVPTTTS